ncbi:TIM-barrel-protein domain-containing protein [Elsinoe ampelina]|uniref:TIM-barrel-protein domain-containing protein n=1 Tax=Elsinoe ampelina TaxID=302913 RepID=A0A6A6GG96_9PEZI|nr:TIM-barrel-protein domain-containing protein [Elsinoe ampelina]
MAPPTDRTRILADFRKQIDAGKPIVGAGAGIGLTAKSIEAGNGDLIIIYNSGRFRMAGRGSLAGLMPYGNANDVVLEMGDEVLPIILRVPVIAGVCASDPFRLMPNFLKQLQDKGFEGVQNFPTVGLIDGTFRANLEETGMGFDNEIEMIRSAHDLEMLTCPYVFDPDQAVKMVDAGADVVVAHMGLTTSGTIGAQTGRTLEQCVLDVEAIKSAAKQRRGDVIVLCHGGPIAEPDHARYVLDRVSGLDGFFGASSMERLPVEKAIKDVAEKFKAIEIKRA